MSEKKAKEERAEQAPKNQQQIIPGDVALQMQNAKVGMLILQIDIMTQQMIALENENKQKTTEIEKLKERLKKVE